MSKDNFKEGFDWSELVTTNEERTPYASDTLIINTPNPSKYDRQLKPLTLIQALGELFISLFFISIFLYEVSLFNNWLYHFRNISDHIPKFFLYVIQTNNYKPSLLWEIVTPLILGIGLLFIFLSRRRLNTLQLFDKKILTKWHFIIWFSIILVPLLIILLIIKGIRKRG